MKKLLVSTFFVVIACIGCSQEKVIIGEKVIEERVIEENQEVSVDKIEKRIEEIKVYKYLIYDSNQATDGTTPLISNEVELGSTTSISDNSGLLRRNDAVFIGWNSERNGSGKHFDVGDEVTINSNMILYAEWGESNLFSEALENELRFFIRSVELKKEKFHILVKEDGCFKLSPNSYDKIIDPFIIRDDAFRFIDDASSEMAGFNHYSNHRYETQYIGASKNGKFGFVDIKNGFKWIIEPKYENVQSFKEGLAAVKFDGKWGYIDYDGEIVIDFEYDYVFDFFNDLSIVANGTLGYGDRKWGVIDKSGKKILDPNTSPYKRIFSFYEPNIAKAYKDSFSSITAIDRKGNVLLEGLHDVGDKGGPISPYFGFIYNSHLCVSAKEKKSGQNDFVYGAFDVNGNWVVDLQGNYETVHQKARVLELSEGSILPHRGDSSWGYINNKNEWIISPQYQYAMKFVDDRAIAKINDYYGVINKENEVVIPFEFSKINRFSRNLATAQKDGAWGIIDHYGNWIIEPEYDHIKLANEIESPFYAQKGNKAYFVTLENKIIHKFDISDRYVLFKDDIAFVYSAIDEIDFDKSQQLYQWYAIDIEGNKIFPSNFYEWITVFIP